MKKLYIIIPMVLILFLYSGPIQAQYTGPTPTVTECVYHDVSPPLQDIIPHPSLPKATDLEETELPDVIIPPKAGALPLGEDPVWQKENGSKGIVSPYRNFEALRNSDNSGLVTPPDSDGDVGPDHYFAMVNNVFQIFNRAGTSLYGPAGNSTIWDGWAPYIGQGISDPIVLYDEQADRWFASVMTTSTSGGNYHILVAVSTTSSPTGTWNRYAWEFSSKPDYPKYGIWPDGYYLGLNRSGDDVLVLERSAMLTGAVADMVAFDNAGKPVPNNTTFNCVLPSDCDGAFPAYGTPNYFWAIGDDAWAAYSYDRLLVWEFHVDWTTPANSTWTGPSAIPTAAFDATFNAFGAHEITQPGTAQEVDCIPWVLMFRPQFRNFGSHYSLVCNHSVDVDGTNHAGVRWYELRKTTGGWYIRQQNTYNPDGDNRWMGSVAMNGSGDIALGYSVSSTTTYPSIRFTGRLADDPLGTMTFTESTIWNGTHSQTDNGRWGDYSMMSVDPVNDHSFWYISEYNGDYGSWDWITQVAAFTLDDYCAASGGCVEYISNVNIGSINNSTVCEEYSNYTHLSTNIHNSSTATLNVTVANWYSGDELSVWVDWDDNDVFSASELIGTDVTEPISFTIDPPSGVIIGEHRMRVRLSYSYPINACGVSNFGEVEDYTLNVTGVAGVWAGTVSSNWNTAANWDDNTIPNSTVSVIIPSGTPYQPTIGTGTTSEYAYCDNLIIQSGATLTQTGTTTYRSFFYVYGNFDSDAGTYNQLTDFGFLYFAGSDASSSWDDDNEDDTYKMVRVQKTGTNTLSMWQDMTVKNLEIREGNFMIDGTWTLTVTGPEIYAFSVEDGGSLTLVDETIDVTTGDVQFEDGSQAFVTGGLIRCGDEFRVMANASYDIQFTGGTVEMYGSMAAQFIEDQDGNTELYDLIIDKSVGSCYLNFGDLIVNNSITINSGALYLNGFELTTPGDMHVYGALNMTNASDILNVGTSYSQRLWFHSGSIGNLFEGVANIFGWFQSEAGCSVTGTVNHTTIFKGVNGGGPNNYEPTATFGNIEVDKNAGARTYISAQTTQPIVVNGDFTNHPGNWFELQDKTMIVHGTLNENSTSQIYVYTATDDKDSDLSKENNQAKDLIIEELSEVNADPPDESGAKGGYLEIDTDFTLYGLLDVGDGEVFLHGHYQQLSSATLTIGSGSFICDEPTTALCSVYGNLNLSTGLFEISNNHLRLNAVCSISGGTIRSGGTFWASIDGNFQPTAGVVELLGTGGSGQYISVHANNYFHDLTINRTNSIFIYTGFDLNIKNNFTILSGGLATNTRDIYIGGIWDNTVGTNAFDESTGKVVFNKSSGGVQYINSDENFNIIENNTSDQIRISSSQDTVTCNSYNRISGGIGVSNGTFIAYDLAQTGIFGNIYALPNSNIYLYQDGGQYVDIYSDWIYVSGGTLNIIGGGDASWWCNGTTSLDLDIINGGVLNFDGPGIAIYDTQPLNDNIDNGTLRTSGYFICNRSDFNPISGTTEFYGGTDALISVQSGSSLHHVLVNKSGGLKDTYTYKDRDGKTQSGTKSNKAYLNVNDLDIMGNLDIDAGTLELTGETLNCYGNAMVNDGGILQLLDNSTIALDNLSDLHVNNGGWLLTIGSAGNPVTITQISGYYDLWIQSGGYISAEHTIFEYMSTAGVYLRPGATVNPVFAFNNCAFQYGYPAGYLLTLYNDQAFTASNVIFPTNTWGSGYNVYKNSGSNDVYFHNATGGFAGTPFELDPGGDVHWTTTPYEVDLTVFLEGPFNDVSTKMDLDMNAMGVIPTSQPYDLNPLADWYYTGPESVGSIPTFAVDWVLVELRDAPNVASAIPGRVVARQAGFVLNNGNVVGLDGLNPLDFNAAIYDNLYVNIWHRNHLGVISANPLINIGGTYSYNFYSGSGQAYGGTSAQVQLYPGMWGILSGDANGSGNITSHDNDNYWGGQAGETGYKVSDFDLDGQVNNQDKNDYWLPNLGADSFIPE